jgi:hypothetical protein
MQSLVQVPAAAVQPVHDGMTTVCRVNVVEDAPAGAFPQPALIPVRVSPVVPELEPLVEPLAAPDVEPLAVPDVEPLAAPEPPVLLVAPDVLLAPLVFTPEVKVPLATPLVGAPEPLAPLMALPLMSEPVTPPAPLVEPLPEPLAPALAPEPLPLSVGPPLQATAVRRATHGSMWSRAF